MGLIVSSPSDPGATNDTLVNVSPYTLLLSDFVLRVDCSSARTINLPDPTLAGKRRWIIFDETGQSATNAITLARFGAETIQSLAASYLLRADWKSWVLECDGTNYWIL